MSFDTDENSIQNSQPIELYLFTYNNVNYTYTSSTESLEANIEGDWYTFNAEYIKRGDSLKLGDSSGNVETCTITVARTNSVALLYQGAPPELDSVRIRVYRVHGSSNNNYVKILDGIVSQARFSGSDVELTITIENVLNRLVPRGKLSYFCQNCIYDERCTLNKDDWALTCYVDIGMEGLKIYSTNLNEKPSGYFTNGYIKMGNSFRGILKHEADCITIKYPINISDLSGSFIAYPGCDGLFGTCASRFNNTDNFSGVPYVQPYNAYSTSVENHPVYWTHGNIKVSDTKGYIFE